jgi:nucleotide-binding universal stress UspA family protein
MSRAARLAVGCLLALSLVACSHDEPESMTERLTGQRTGALDPSSQDDDRPASQRFPEFAPFFEDQPEGVDMVEEQMLWGWDDDDAFGWINQDHQMGHTHVVDGIRDTYQVADPVFTIWLFGGSTAFGFGQRDDFTIASQMVKLAEERGVQIEVVNFGVSGYVNWQEVDRFAAALEKGPAPDLALFFDGANESALAIEREAYGLLDPADTYHLSMEDEQRDELAKQAKARGYRSTNDLDTAATVQAEQYRRGAERALELGQEHGVDVVLAWQPHLYTIDPDAPLVPEALDLWEISPKRQKEVGQLSDEIAERSGIDVIDLSSSLDDARKPVFFDISHSNEYGARLQAEVLLDQVWPAIDGSS